MSNFFKMHFYGWNGLNHELSQKLHLLIENDTALSIFKFFTEYIGYYKMFPIHLMVIIFIMTINLFIQKDRISKEKLRNRAIQNFQLVSTLVITIICMAATIGVAKEIFSLTRPICMANFTLSEYALQYKHVLTKTKSLHTECNLSFPSGHSSYSTAMLVALWGWFTKPFQVIGVITLILVILSRIALGMHFLADVLFAILIAGFIALAVKHIMQTFFCKRSMQRTKS